MGGGWGGGDFAQKSASESHSLSSPNRTPTENRLTHLLFVDIFGVVVNLVLSLFATYSSDDNMYIRDKRSGEGWEKVVRVGATRDLASDVSDFRKEATGGAKSSSTTTRAQHHVRALSFSYPQRSVMEDFAETWRSKVRGAASSEMTTAAAAETTIVAVGEEFDDYDDDDDEEEDMNDEEGMDDEDMDDDDLDDYLQMMSASRAAVSSSPSPPPLFVDGTGSSGVASAVVANGAVGVGGATTTTTAATTTTTTTTTTTGEDVIVSPFERAAEIKVDHRDYESTSEYDDATKKQSSATTSDAGSPLELTVENVDAVLDEVRPYLISDGGNVSVRGVGGDGDGDGEGTPPSGGRKNVYLVLEGACGSCASSTVTMKMGIERVLREKFGDALGGVVQVDPASEDGGDGGGKATCLTMEAVRAEVERMSQAIVARGGVVRISKVDPEFGVVTIDYRGPNRVRRGLELALLDVEYVRHVEFVSS